MNRRVAATLLALSLIALAPATSVSADTGGGPPEPIDVFLAQTGFAFTDRSGVAYSGIAQVEDNRLAGTKSVSFFFSGAGALQMCDAGTPDDPTDDYQANDSIEFFADRSQILEYRLADDLSRAVVKLALAGPRSQHDACTGELERIRREHHEFEFRLGPTAPPNPVVEVFCRPIGDGSSRGVQVTEILTVADAVGPAVLDDRRVSQEFGSLQRFQAILGGPCEVPPES